MTWVSLLKPVGEQRADRPVDQARGQRFLLGRAALALEEAAGDLAGGEGLFLVVDGEREEVDAGPLLPGGDDGGEHGGLAVGGEHGAVGLAGDLAGFENELAPGPLDLDTLNVEHGIFLSCDGHAGRAMGKTARSSPIL